MKENKGAKKYFISSAILLVIFAILTVLVKTVDVKAVGPIDSKIGLSAINTCFRDLVGVNMTLYEMTELLGYLAIGVAGLFALIGAYQLIKGKSIKAVDTDILALGGLLVALACAYVFFEIVIINYRPIIIDGKLEASFPSSHTMLALCIFGAAIHELWGRIKNKTLCITLTVICAVLMTATVIGRLLSGAHWFTDIIAGMLLSTSLLLFYVGFCRIAFKTSERV